MLESLFEPIQAEEDDKRVDCYGIAQHGYEEQDDLLICSEKIDINGVEPGLRASPTSKEQRVDVRHILDRIH